MRPWQIITDGLSEMAAIILLHTETQNAPNDDERGKMYRKRETDWADRGWFWEVFTDFLWKKRGKLADAGACFQKAFDINPDHLARSTEYKAFVAAHPELRIKDTIISLLDLK